MLKKTLKQSPILINGHSLSSKHLLTLGAMLVFIASGVVYVVAQSTIVQSSHLASAPAKKIESMKHYFFPERLEAFSGYEFNLKPNLIAFLDQMEANLAYQEKGKSEILTLAEDYFRFVNPASVSYEIYRIKNGDNYWKIAKKRGYTIDTIVGSNPHLERIVCYVNQKVILPSRGGSLHQVQYNENVKTIALDYGVPFDAIEEANLIDTKWGILPGMWLFVPGAKPRHLSEKMHDHYSRRALFRSPLAGRYTSFVGKRTHPVTGFSKFHNGLDIACPMNTWVGSSAAGTVVKAGWGGPIGKYIKIDHHNGYQSVYGHLNKIYVKRGQKVPKGKLIGRSGKTGRVTGPHLHYTIYKNGRVVDPMDYIW